MRIQINWAKGSVTGTLRDTPAARQLYDKIPFESEANTWGQEIYFQVPVSVELEPDAVQVVDPGTICFWVQGGALAIPFGPTPVSQGDECRLVTEVNVLGKLDDDASCLATIADGDAIKVVRANN